MVSGPYASEEDALRASGGELRAGRQLFAVPEGMAVVTCGEGAVVCPGAGGAGVAPDRTYYYLFDYDPPNVPQMTGEDFKLSGTRADFDTSPGGAGRPIVTMEFTDAAPTSSRTSHATCGFAASCETRRSTSRSSSTARSRRSRRSTTPTRA